MPLENDKCQLVDQGIATGPSVRSTLHTALEYARWTTPLVFSRRAQHEPYRQLLSSHRDTWFRLL